MGQRARVARTLFLLALAAWVLGTWSVRAWYGRWVADDFCFAVSALHAGFWRSQLLTYQSWNGRFTATFLAEALTFFGPAAARWIAIGAMAVWLAAAWRWSGALGRAGQDPKTERLAIVLGFVAAVVNAAPDAFQPLVWTTGLVTYGLPVIGATAIAAMIDSPAPLLFVVALLFGGCSEIAAMAQAVLAVSLAIVVPRVRQQLVAVAAGSATAFAIVVAAPGNFHRRAFFHPLPIPDAVLGAVAKTIPIYARILVEGCTLFVPLVAVLAFARPRISWRVAAAAFVASIVIVTTTIFAALAGTGRLPWGRVQFVAIAYVAIALVFVAFAVRIERYAAVATLATVAFVAIGFVTTLQTRLDEIHDSRQFAAIADRIAGAPAPVVAAPHDFDYLEFIGRDPDHWSNRCIADYYRLQSIRSSR